MLGAVAVGTGGFSVAAPVGAPVGGAVAVLVEVGVAVCTVAVAVGSLPVNVGFVVDVTTGFVVALALGAELTTATLAGGVLETVAVGAAVGIPTGLTGLVCAVSAAGSSAHSGH